MTTPPEAIMLEWHLGPADDHAALMHMPHQHSAKFRQLGAVNSAAALYPCP